jgi:hypothetical protein
MALLSLSCASRRTQRRWWVCWLSRLGSGSKIWCAVWVELLGRPVGPSRPALLTGAGRKVSSSVRQVDQGLVVLTASCVGWLIQTAVGSFGGAGGLRTNRSGWAA